MPPGSSDMRSEKLDGCRCRMAAVSIIDALVGLRDSRAVTTTSDRDMDELPVLPLEAETESFSSVSAADAVKQRENGSMAKADSIWQNLLQVINVVLLIYGMQNYGQLMTREILKIDEQRLFRRGALYLQLISYSLSRSCDYNYRLERADISFGYFTQKVRREGAYRFNLPGEISFGYVGELCCDIIVHHVKRSVER